jgi:hypothetical protein
MEAKVAGTSCLSVISCTCMQRQRYLRCGTHVAALLYGFSFEHLTMKALSRPQCMPLVSTVNFHFSCWAWSTTTCCIVRVGLLKSVVICCSLLHCAYVASLLRIWPALHVGAWPALFRQIQAHVTAPMAGGFKSLADACMHCKGHLLDAITSLSLLGSDSILLCKLQSVIRKQHTRHAILVACNSPLQH